MHRKSKCAPSGQSLVEFALVIPSVMLIVVWIAHFLMLMHVKVELVNEAAHMANAMSLDPLKMGVGAEGFARLSRFSRWGQPYWPETRTKVFTPYRPWTGRTSSQEPGRMASADLTFLFRSRAAGPWYSKVGLPLRAHVEFPVESSFPGQGS